MLPTKILALVSLLPAAFATQNKGSYQGYPCDEKTTAFVTLAGKGAAKGTLTFTQQAGSSEVTIEGEVTGLSPGKHGFHVHQSGDISDGCASMGGHYNPFKRNHGAPEDKDRHIGDLGNIEAGADGVAKVSMTDHYISLCGKRTIFGRGFVIHEGEDDLGRGNQADSKTTGHAGNRACCGIIGVPAPAPAPA